MTLLSLMGRTIRQSLHWPGSRHILSAAVPLGYALTLAAAKFPTRAQPRPSEDTQYDQTPMDLQASADEDEEEHFDSQKTQSDDATSSQEAEAKLMAHLFHRKPAKHAKFAHFAALYQTPLDLDEPTSLLRAGQAAQAPSPAPPAVQEPSTGWITIARQASPAFSPPSRQPREKKKRLQSRAPLPHADPSHMLVGVGLWAHTFLLEPTQASFEQEKDQYFHQLTAVASTYVSTVTFEDQSGSHFHASSPSTADILGTQDALPSAHHIQEGTGPPPQLPDV